MLEYWNIGKMEFGLRFVKLKARRGYCNIGDVVKFGLKIKFKIDYILQKPNIPLLHD